LENVKELHEHCAKNNLVAADGLHFNLAVSSVVPRKRGERNPDVVVVAVDIEHDREIVKSLEVVVASLRQLAVLVPGAVVSDIVVVGDCLLHQIDKLKVEVPVEADAVERVGELQGAEAVAGALIGGDRIHPSIIRRAFVPASIAELKLIPCVGRGVGDSDSRDIIIESIVVEFCLSNVV
jgi:hypothetical protein